MIKNIVVLSLLALSAMQALAINKCVDPAGKTSYQETACPDKSNQAAVDLTYRTGSGGSPKLEEKIVEKPKLAPSTTPPSVALDAAPVVSLKDRLTSMCVETYQPHLAYPNGVKVKGSSLERSLSEMHIIVYVRTITNPATPVNIDPIFLDERFICVTDFGSGLNERSTSFYTDRYKKGERL